MSYLIFPSAVSKDECKTLLDYCLRNLSLNKAFTIKEGFGLNDGDESLETSPERSTTVGFINNTHEEINNRIWGFIRNANEKHSHYNLDFFQEIQFAKYNVGDYYNWHQDSMFAPENPLTRKLSLTMSLSDHEEYDGGHLQFFNGGKPNTVNPNLENDIKSVGTVIVFDSYDWHRITPVTRGVRYSLVCWTVGPNFV